MQRVVGEVGPLKGCAMNEGDFELYGGTLGACNVFQKGKRVVFQKGKRVADALHAAVDYDGSNASSSSFPLLACVSLSIGFQGKFHTASCCPLALRPLMCGASVPRWQLSRCSIERQKFPFCLNVCAVEGDGVAGAGCCGAQCLSHGLRHAEVHPTLSAHHLS